jgi:DNA (cytosine-5)-methyltransferase 1
MKAVELFAGAGGLGMGISKAGFDHEAVIEWDQCACDTIRENQRRGISPVSGWPLYQGDVRQFDFSRISDTVDLLSGGPPCQPFSLGGKHRGHKDERNMFPEVFRAVRQLKPKVVLIENVKGLLRRSFAEYFEYIVLQLTYPEIARKHGEAWTDHLSRLEQHHTGGCYKGLYYRVVFRLVNAADYGVPQRRERVLIVALRSDLGLDWSFPTATHSRESLLWDQWGSSDYWERNRIAKKNRPPMPAAVCSRLPQLEATARLHKPWRTVREAISDLPDPTNEGKAGEVSNHKFMAGARVYPGHTGSLLDEPAKTLKAGDHGVPGGENMLAYPNGNVRYCTVRESARLQTFPDDFVFHCSWTEAMRQLGNAVPVSLAQTIATGIKSLLDTSARSA